MMLRIGATLIVLLILFFLYGIYSVIQENKSDRGYIWAERVTASAYMVSLCIILLALLAVAGLVLKLL